jgi:hypothetical protein
VGVGASTPIISQRLALPGTGSPPNVTFEQVTVELKVRST